MAELIEQILTLSKAERLKIAMQILLSIQDEESDMPEWHERELNQFQEELKVGKIKYISEEEFNMRSTSELKKKLYL